MKIFKCGTRVKTTLENIEGIITGVTIRFNAVAYEISYFYNGEHRQVWLNESEFTTEAIRTRLGFIK